MALNISGYVDPGVYIAEVVVPGSASLNTVPLTTTLVGTGSRNKRASNEALVRGGISNESLTVGSGAGAHDATLINAALRNSATLTVYKDGVELDPSQFSFRPAALTGVALTTLNFTAPNNRISLSLDGRADVTIVVTSGGAYTTTVSGGVITQQMTGVTISALTPAQIADAINRALSGATSLYGAAYGAVATVSVDKVVVTSPLSTSASDVRVYPAHPVAQSQSAAIFGTISGGRTIAPTVVRIVDAAYDALSVYTADYIALNSETDSLAQANVQSMVRVGAFPNTSTYFLARDYSRSGQTLDWSLDAAAVFTGSSAVATRDLSVNDKFMLSLDGKAAIEIDLNGLGSPPAGYVNPGTPAAATNAEIVANINAILAASAVYGPRYASVATTANNVLILTSVNQGVGGSVEISSTTSNSAVTALFGLTSGQLPYSVYGTGSRPSVGTVFYATYDYTRPSTDYNRPKLYFTPDQVYADVGYPSATNKLAQAAGVAFENGASSVYVVQVDDSTFPGSPTTSEFLAALNSTNVPGPTEICPLTTNLQTQTDLLNNIVNQNSPTEKNYRRGWFGMARGTLVGDRDTPDTFVYRSVRTLQVPADSPARGRLILVAPSSISRNYIAEDGSTKTVNLDGSFAAVAIAARMTSFTSPSETLMRKNIVGFNITDFPTYNKQERAILASNGVTVVTLDGGRLTLLDPISTEGGGGRLTAFQEISASTQKDAVTRAIEQVVNNNLVGVVPSDLAQFVFTVKITISNAIAALITNGSIGPYRNESGVVRDIDLTTDIQVFQSPTDQTQFNFRYFYNLRYPAKRFFGEYSVDAPFFG